MNPPDIPSRPPKPDSLPADNPAAVAAAIWYGRAGRDGSADYGGLHPERRHPDDNLVRRYSLDGESLPKDPSGNPWAPAQREI